MCRILIHRRPTVYVLMRLFCPDLSDAEGFLLGLYGALNSVKDNRVDYARRGGRTVLLLNDDTRRAQGDALYQSYADKRDALLNSLFDKCDWRLIDEGSGGGEGSAYAMFKLRKYFVQVAEKKRDIAVILDQDDELKKKAIRRIARKMWCADVVVAPFEMVDDNNIDITDDGGLLHKRACRWWRVRRRIVNLSSIGWTKSCRRSVAETYVNDIESLMCGVEGVRDFYVKHLAFEDFIDYYMLLLKGVRVRGLWKESHRYIKNKASITARPTEEAFSDYRTAMLVALVDLCYSQRKKLRKRFEIGLLRFVASKVGQIESIIEKYRKSNRDGWRERCSDFKEMTYDGFFLTSLCQQFSKTAHSKENFANLFSARNFNRVRKYHEKTTADDPQIILGRAADRERALRNRRRIQKTDDDIVKRLMDGNPKMPHQPQYYRLIGLLVLAAILLVPAIFIWKNEAIVVACATLLGVVLTVMSSVKATIIQEKATMKLYYSEFVDLIRHLEANIKVMVQIQKELGEDGRGYVQDVHFSNLKWPESSSLFSNEMAKLIDQERVDEYARLKVNLRNINNSAVWLTEMARRGEALGEALEWEITRYFGYLVSVYYMAEHDFHFPSTDERDRYLNDKDVRNRLAALFMGCSDDERAAKVEHYLTRYYKDRSEKRAVLISRWS